MKGFHTLFANLILTCLGVAPLLAQPLDKVDTLSASVIVASHDRAVLSGLTTFDGSRLRTGVSVLGVPDIVRSLKMLPGVAAGMEITAGLYVHGGDGSDNLFLLDGVPLFQVAHLGGMLSSFNTEAINTLGFYKSGFPARFGGRLSSVVEIVPYDELRYELKDADARSSLAGQVEGRFFPVLVAGRKMIVFEVEATDASPI